MEHNYTYTDAFNELHLLVSEIENGEANVDELATKIKRASELIAICKAKLTSSEKEVEDLLSKLTLVEEATAPDTEEE